MTLITLKENYDLVDSSKYPLANFPFEKFNPVQSGLFPVYNDDANIIVAASTSAGKAQPDNSLILTPKGYVRLDGIMVGDAVTGSDGKPTTVIGVFPQGVKKVYKVSLSDDTHTLCCADHLWNVRTRHDKARANPWRTLSLKDILASNNEFHIPLVNAVEFSPIEFAIHPYMLGLLLGDGGIKYGVKISNADQDVLDKLASLLPPTCHLVHDKSYDYRIVDDFEAQNYNEVARELDQMSLLGKGSQDKFVPYLYLRGSIEQRLELLRGLMDSDGGGYSNKSPYFDTGSKQLAEHIAYLIRSLGGWTRIRKREVTNYTYRGQKLQGQPSYRLTVVLPYNPFHCKRKTELWHQREKDVLRKIESIELVGEMPCRCIKVDNDDGLYVTNDFIVTHNTVCAEMLMAHEVRERKNKVIYLSPLKSLSQEQLDKWTSEFHHFGDCNVAICTGDYRLTAARRQELEVADIIIMTSEMLNSTSRNARSEKNQFLQGIGLIVIDESHLIGVAGRGDHLESGIMKFTDINHEARLLLLSATMPNVNDVGKWLSHLNGKKTYLLQSDYRPCKLNIHYERYFDLDKGYEETERAKVALTIRLLKKYADDKFICFVHTKKTGEMLVDALINAGIECDYHNANLDKDKRVKIERRFREDPKLRVIVATSGLAQGLNMPARRVIVLGLNRGFATLVDVHEIVQECGRAGRPQYDSEGDAHILVPSKDFNKHVERLKKPQRIESQMKNSKVLAFHLVSEIHHGYIKTIDDIHNWYKLTLAYFQEQKLDEAVVDQVINHLLFTGCIREEDGEYKVTAIGTVASMFYYSPFDAADLYKNFNKLFEVEKADHEAWSSMALGNLDSNRMNIVNTAEQREMEEYKRTVVGRIEKTLSPKYEFTLGAIKAGYCYWLILNGKTSGIVNNTMRTLQLDFGRTSEVLTALDTMSGKWDQQEFIKRLGLRITYGVSDELAGLCQLEGVGKMKAQRLWAAGLRELDQVAKNLPGVLKALNCSQKVGDKIVENAKFILEKKNE